MVLTAMQPRAVPNRLTATLTDGREIVLQVDDVPGFVTRPMTRDDVERKFRETRLYQVAPISTNLILSYVAEHVLGLPRSF